MNRKNYMTGLLELCSEKQKTMFGRIYPDGPAPNQVEWAIKQVSNTLKSGNQDTENLKGKITELEDKATDFERIKSEYRRTITELEQEVRVLKNSLNQKSIDTDNVDIQKQLMLLDALEAGGVDNWDWYGESIQRYEKEHGVELF